MFCLPLKAARLLDCLNDLVLRQQLHLMEHDLGYVTVLLPAVLGSFPQKLVQIQRPEEALDRHPRSLRTAAPSYCLASVSCKARSLSCSKWETKWPNYQMHALGKPGCAAYETQVWVSQRRIRGQVCHAARIYLSGATCILAWYASAVEIRINLLDYIARSITQAEASVSGNVNSELTMQI